MVKAQRYDCAVQQERHYEFSREYVLHHLGKNTYLNGNQFAIIWISSSGEVETYASQGVLDGMRRWFNDDVMQEARDLTEEAYRKTRPPRCNCSTSASSDDFQPSSAACAEEAKRADQDIAALCQFENGARENIQVSTVNAASAVDPVPSKNQKASKTKRKKSNSKGPSELSENESMNNSENDEDDEDDCDTNSDDMLQILQVPVPPGSNASSATSSSMRRAAEAQTTVKSTSSSVNSNNGSTPRTPHTDLSLNGPNTNFIHSAPAQFNAHKRVQTAPTDTNSAEMAMRMIFAPVEYKFPFDCDSNNIALKSKIVPSGENLAAVWRVPAANIHAYFRLRFMQLQQILCKMIAKSWIKVVEPKKQSRFPYKDGDTRRPDWWPVNARHKEPDHLKKPEERISLLLSILTSPLCTTNLLELSTVEIEDQASPEKLTTLREMYRTNREYERRRRMCPEMIAQDYEVYVAVGTPPLEAVGFKVSGGGPDFCTTRSGKRKRTFPVLHEADPRRIGSSTKWPPQPLFINNNERSYNPSLNQNTQHIMAQSAPPTQTMFNLDFNLQTGQPLTQLPQTTQMPAFLKNNSQFNPPTYHDDMSMLSRQWQGSADDLSMPPACPPDLSHDISAYASSLPTPPISARASHVSFPYNAIQRSYSSPSNGLPQIHNLSMVGNELDHSSFQHNAHNFYSMVPSNLGGMPMSPPQSSVHLSDIS